MTMRLFLMTILFLMAVMQFAVAQDSLPQTPGRYQIIALPKTPTELGSTALLLDTATGNLWLWEQAPGFGKSAGGSGIFYQGKAVPGNVPGVPVARSGFGAPTIPQAQNSN